jgi:hypothetical protein
MAVVVTIAGVNRTAVVKWDTLDVTQLADSFTFTAELTIFDADSDIVIVAGSHLVADEITIVDGATTFFGGYVANQNIETLEVPGGSRNLHLQCQGYGILLTETLIEFYEASSRSDALIINDLFTTYLSTIDSSTYVATLNASMDVRFENMTLSECLDALTQRTKGRYYIDNSKALHYFESEGDAAPFDLSDTPNQSTTFSYFDANDKEVDGSQIVNRVKVIGADGFSAVRNDATSQTAYGIRAVFVEDTSLVTTAELEERGDAILDKNKDPRVTYNLKTFKGGAVAGQDIGYKNDVLGVDDTFTIREQRIYWWMNEPVYEMTLGEVNIDSLRRPGYTDTQIRVLQGETGPLGSWGWSSDIIFSATDNDTVAWGTGTITLSGGVGSYSIVAGNTGNMAAATWIYLDTDVSITVLQTTTSAANAVGKNKVMVCWAQNVADATKYAAFQPFGSNTSGGTFVVADNIATDTLTANEIAANAITASEINANAVTADKILAGAVTTVKLDAGAVTADKLTIGPTPFTPDNGLLLLGQPMRLLRGTTNYWESTRGQLATLGGAFHPVQGKWVGSQAFVCDPAATNLLDNTRFGTNTTGWATGGTNTIARSTDQAKFGDYSLKCTYGNTAAQLASYGITLTAAAHSLAMEVYIPSNYDGTDLAINWNGFTGGVGTSTVSADMTKRNVWQRVEAPNFTPDAGDLTGNVRIRENGSAPTAGRFVYIDGIDVIQSDISTSHIDGSLGDGYAWVGTVDGSDSTRAASYILLNGESSMFNSNNTFSFAVVLQAPYDYDATWPEVAGNRIFDLFEDASNDIRINYDAGDNRFEAIIVSGGTGISLNSSVIQFSAGDFIHVALTVDFGSDEYKLYINASLEDTDTTALAAITGFSQFNIGSNQANGQQGGFAFTEVSAFDDVLTLVEIEEIYQLKQPMIDFGADFVPGILLTSHDGDRIEITAKEVAVYALNDKAVEIDKDGIAILVDESFEDIRSYQFVDSGGAVIAQMEHRKNTVSNITDLKIVASAITGYDTQASLEANSPSGEQAVAYVQAYQGAGSFCNVSCVITTGGVEEVWLVVNGTAQAVATTTGLEVYGISGDKWKFHNVASGADLAATRRLHVEINGSNYTILAVTGWV